MNEIVKKTVDTLTTRERTAYRYSIERKEPFLSGSLSDQLYSLYEAGRTCEEIQALNKGISLGTIIRARIDNNWDERKLTYLEGLQARARTQAHQLSLESLSFLGDLMTAFHKHDRNKLQRFIQTGDADELKGVMIQDPATLKMYQNVVELLMKLTGQDATKTVSTVNGVVEHHHTLDPAPSAKPLTPKEAADLLSAVVINND